VLQTVLRVSREELLQAAVVQLVLAVLFSFSGLSLWLTVCLVVFVAVVVLCREPDTELYQENIQVQARAQSMARPFGVRVERAFLNPLDPYNATWHRTGRRRGVVVLGEALLTDDVCFDATLLHELGHARQLTGLACVVHSCARFAVPAALGSTFGLSALLVLPLGSIVVEVVAAKYYRIQEIDADRFAVAQGAPAEAILRYIPDSSDGVLDRAISTHPRVVERRAALGLFAGAA
jgi:Zn-dependent protease with chaperone function